ncbi:VWA domain-containing protein [Mangrovimonas sp. TPBH4]|uniref:VWA domain-containing protein n=1 Tax=Mangrovimonas sp. TPBH4 TaxID=1645914 RepID=UPI0006B45848|nr:VWA domain-containing protein [Mangrovimonas sp. TPBH4]
MKPFLKPILLATSVAVMCSCNANNSKPITTDLTTAYHAPITNDQEQYIKVALLLDTSNSMDGLIDQAKAQLWKIVNELSYAKCNGNSPKLQIALYEYGTDNLNADNGYIRQILSFSDDLDEISKQLFSLTTNGGQEYCGQVIQTSIERLQWGNNQDDLKLIFIAGNEPFSQGPINYKKASELAVEKHISVNTIFCGDYNLGINTYWKSGADVGHGNYMAIDHNRQTVYVATPYDNEILQLNQKLNGTYVAYGSVGKDKIREQQVQDVNASISGKASGVSRTVSKSTHLYTNSNWDLVDAVSNEELKLEDLKSSELPEELKGKSTSEIKAYVAAKEKERKAIQQQIQELNKKRLQFIEANNTEEDKNLEQAMVNAIKTQAKKKNYQW